ncbi:hypothetical protein HYV86_00265 [Candidatus Woesearchaeota archaeon]|nr:hypothetical protein [Candidatus Woesearchaeota archaeon]
MLAEDQILSFIRTSGPTIPSKVAKIIKTEILIASAHLSDLSSRGKVKVSSLKWGGSPLYYVPGQESQLYNFAKDNLNPKDFEVLEMLRNEGVLREAELELLPRVAIRSLKDFAVPLQVTTPDKTELFWKWHMLTNQEANERIAYILHPPAQIPITIPEEVPDLAVVEPEQDIVSNKSNEDSIKPVVSTLMQDKSIEKERKTVVRKQREKQKTIVEVEEKTPIDELLVAHETSKPEFSLADPFFAELKSYCQIMNMFIADGELVRKNAEINLRSQLHTPLGKVHFFCKAKKKAKVDEKDLSAAFIEAQMKKLPLLFLYTGELTKKAVEMVDANAFENAIIRRIERK